MALTPSTMLELGTQAPDFSLPDTGDEMVSLSQFKGRPLLVMFICNHCPYVKHIREGLASLGRDYASSEMAIVAINSNDAENYPDDGPEKMVEEKRRYNYPFPYLFDGDQRAAKAYRAACTPDFFLFNAQHQLVYRGQMDDSRPGNGIPVTGRDLRQAMDATLAGEEIGLEQTPSVGCNIKWKPGNAPDYF